MCNVVAGEEGSAEMDHGADEFVESPGGGVCRVLGHVLVEVEGLLEVDVLGDLPSLVIEPLQVEQEAVGSWVRPAYWS